MTREVQNHPKTVLLYSLKAWVCWCVSICFYQTPLMIYIHKMRKKHLVHGTIHIRFEPRTLLATEMPIVKVLFHPLLRIWSRGTRWRQSKFMGFQCCGMGWTLGVGCWFTEASKSKLGPHFDYNHLVSPTNSLTHSHIHNSGTKGRLSKRGEGLQNKDGVFCSWTCISQMVLFLE